MIKITILYTMIKVHSCLNNVIKFANNLHMFYKELGKSTIFYYFNV